VPDSGAGSRDRSTRGKITAAGYRADGFGQGKFGFGWFRACGGHLGEVERRADRPAIAGRHTVTLKRLPMLVEPSFRSAVNGLLQECLTKSEFARDWRNRRIAHNDLVLATQMNATPLAPASRQNVKDRLISRRSRSAGLNFPSWSNELIIVGRRRSTIFEFSTLSIWAWNNSS